MRSLLLLALALFSFELQESARPFIGAKSENVECVTCEGNGLVFADCWGCHGTGEYRCPNETKLRPTRYGRWLNYWIPDAIYLNLRESTKDLKSNFDFNRALYGSEAPKATKLSPGEVKCPARCIGGKKQIYSEWLDCKLCRGGKFRCTLCKKGQLPCNLCDGEGELPVECFDCSGLGVQPDPTALPVEHCPRCLGREIQACGTCNLTGKVQLPCEQCLGFNLIPCFHCKGSEKLPCSSCGGRAVVGRKQRDCRDCKEKGFSKCTKCTQGWLKCVNCDGQSLGLVDCPDCAGKKLHPCGGCRSTAYGAWEYTARWFLARDQFEAASKWLEAADERCSKRYEESIESVAQKDDRKLLRLIQKELKGELKKLDKLRKSIAKAAAE